MAILAGGGVGAALGEVHRNATSPRPSRQPRFRTYETSSFHTFRRPRIVAKAPFRLDRVTVTGHGGTAVIEWYCGSMAPLVSPATEVVGLYLDGTEIAETVASGRGGQYDARDGTLRWVGTLQAGSHVISVSLRVTSGAAAIPMVVAGVPVPEGVDVTEHVRS